MANTTRSRAALASRAKEIERLTKAGWSSEKIAKKLGISPRTVHRYRSTERQIGERAPEPKDTESLPPEARRTVERSLRGFLLFYQRYSGRDLPMHSREWIREALVHDRLLLNVPPRHAKSEILSVWFVIWNIACDRNVQILLISQTEKLAKKFTNKIAWHLEYNQKLIQDFGRFKPFDDTTPWRPLNGELMVEGRTRHTESGDLTLQVRGAGQQILGMEADIIIGDDVVDRKSAWSPATRDHLSEYWSGDVMTRLSPKGRAIVVGQCIHYEDLYAELGAKIITRGARQGQHVWHRIVYPAILDWDEEKVLWPEEWPFDRLMDTYEDLKRKGDSWLFETMYQQNPVPASERLVQQEWLDGDDAHPGCFDRHRRLGQEPTPGDGESYVRVVSIDPSPERACGIIVADVLHDRKLFQAAILEAVRGRMDVREMLLQLERITEVYRPEYLVFEQNAFARWFLQDPRFRDWQRRHSVRVIPHTTGRNKSDPDYGVQTLALHFEFGRIRIPYGDPAAREQMALLIEEATNYPFGTYTDLLMALWFIAYNHAKLTPAPAKQGGQRRGSSTFRVPERLKAGFRYAQR